MTKSEKFAKAIKEALATVEQHRTLYWKLCHEYAAKSAEEGSNEELINQLSAFLFAAKATNLEAQAVCACYIAYTDLFEAQTRENSPRLQPIRDAIRAAGYSVDYDPTTIVYKSGQNAVSASFSVGPLSGSSTYTYGRGRLLNGDYLRSELKRLKAKATNLEAQAVCACYIAYTDLFEAQTRENSPRLQPIRDAIRAAGYSVDYDPTTIVYKSGQNAVSASFSVGPLSGSSTYTYGRGRLLNGDYLRSELKRLKEADSGKTPAEIINDAKAAAAAWQMLKKQRKDYQNNIRKLRQMLKGISFYNWAQIWHV